MADIRTVENLAPDRQVTTYQGVMVKVDGVLAVNVNGNVLPARWADPVVVAAGDAVLVEISSSRAGQGSAFVRGRLTDNARPGKGTVLTVPPGSPTITVTGDDGTTYTANFIASYSPIVGDPVLLSWNASLPTVTGKITTTPATSSSAAPVAPPPTASAAGKKDYPASDSDTYWPAGGWGSWAGGGGHVYQGNYGAGQVYGAWFYAGATAQTAGKSLSKIYVHIGSRRAVGNHRAPATLHLYGHTSANKPGGDVTRTVGPFDIVVQPGQGLTKYEIPVATFGAVLQGGGGLAITGDPYAGVNGCQVQPESGLITLEWSA